MKRAPKSVVVFGAVVVSVVSYGVGATATRPTDVKLTGFRLEVGNPLSTNEEVYPLRTGMRLAGPNSPEYKQSTVDLLEGYLPRKPGFGPIIGMLEGDATDCA